jgi:carbon-monoxide dehydrogenase small subunit
LAANDRRQIALTVNGRIQRIWAAPHDLLLNVLRNDLELTGTKYGCGIGECSACTVLMDGKPVLSCLVLAVEAAGHDIVTIEGLAAPDGTLDPLQEAFIDYGANQCGYCTPGQILTAKSLLNEVAHPTEDDVRRHLRGNMCRCTGYAAIVRAVLAAAETTTKDD